ncbi:MAG: putative signal peptidase [Pedosphaera sp.]|nr:putative signal peptidase [Pedosphaera sp.]
MKTPDALPPADEPAAPSASVTRAGRNARQFRLLLYVALWSVMAYFFISHYVLMAVEIKGTSMSPTLIDGERYLLYRCTYLVRTPRKGEIVVIKDPEDHGLSIKRIVALPDETVEMRPDGLYVNNVKLPEPYLISKYTFGPHNEPTKPIRVAKNSYFVLGDNRNRSADSRIYGPVPLDQILGVISK